MPWFDNQYMFHSALIVPRLHSPAVYIPHCAKNVGRKGEGGGGGGTGNKAIHNNKN